MSHLARTERIVLGGVVVMTTLAGLGRYGGWPSLLAFCFSALALAGLAHIVSLGVEQVGERLGHGIAGLMQASLGNLPELFLVIFALREGEVILAQSTVLGSIFSNALLVLGLVILVGTRVTRDGVMRFHHRLPNDTATLLIVTTFIIVIVGLSLTTHDPASTHVATVSAIAAVALLGVYLLWVVPYVRGDVAAAGAAGPVEEEPEQARHEVPLAVPVFLLAFGGAGAAFDSEWFITALKPTVDELGISRAFAGLVIAAIAGNAVENITAVILASKGQADLAISVVKNSVGQMAAFMWPALVLISLPLTSKLTFALPPVYIGALLVTALAMWQITGDGEAVAFEGFALVALYLTLAVVTLYE